MVRRMLLALLLCAALLLTACGLPGAPDAFSGADSASAAPDLRLLEWPAMSDAVPDETEAPASGAPLLVDLWLDASQVMGGINIHEESVYPHFSRKYREGGFHYRYGSQVGMYEGVLRCLLAAAEGSRVRVLRAIMMPSGRPSASAMASEISPICREMGIFSATISVMATPLRKTFDSPRSP